MFAKVEKPKSPGKHKSNEVIVKRPIRLKRESFHVVHSNIN